MAHGAPGEPEADRLASEALSLIADIVAQRDALAKALESFIEQHGHFSMCSIVHDADHKGRRNTQRCIAARAALDAAKET